MSQYEPLIPKYPPASIPEIVAHIQKYLALNGVVPGVASVCGVMPNNDHNIPLKGSDIPLQSMSVQTIAQAIEAISTALSNLSEQVGNQGTAITALGPYNDLDSDSTTAALSAAQGKALNDLIGALGPYNGLDSDSTAAALSAAQGKALNNSITQISDKLGFSINYKGINPQDWNTLFPSTNNCIDIYVISGQMPNGSPTDAFAYGILIVIGVMSNNDWTNVMIYLPDSIDTKGMYLKNKSKTAWLKITGNSVADKTE